MRKPSRQVLKSGSILEFLTDGGPQRFARQLDVWSRLSHPHVLKFYGVSPDAVHNSGLSIVGRLRIRSIAPPS